MQVIVIHRILCAWIFNLLKVKPNRVDIRVPVEIKKLGPLLKNQKMGLQKSIDKVVQVR
jgi:hypothetical protein